MTLSDNSSNQRTAAVQLHVLHVRVDEPGGVAQQIELLGQFTSLFQTSVQLISQEASRSPKGWAKAIGLIRHQIKMLNPNAVHAHGVRAALPAVVAGRLQRVPVVATIHGLHSIRRTSGRWSLITRMANRLVLSSCSRVLVPNKTDLALITRLGLAPKSKVRSVRYAFKPPSSLSREEARAVLDFPPAALVIAWVGRFDKQKDPLTFCRAMERLQDQPNILGVMAGDGPLLDEVRNYLATSGMRNVVLTGWLSEPAPVFHAADVYVSTARWEGLPISVLEAASLSLPLVLSDCPGNDELSQEAAVFFPATDSDQLSSRLDLVLGSEKLRRQLGASARTFVLHEYDSQALAEELAGIYASLN